MEAQGGGLLHTNMTHRRRRREETVDLTRHTLGCHLLTKTRKRRGKKRVVNTETPWMKCLKKKIYTFKLVKNSLHKTIFKKKKIKYHRKLDLLKEKLLTFFATVVSDQMHKGGVYVR